MGARPGCGGGVRRLSDEDATPPELAALGVDDEAYAHLRTQHFFGRPEQVVPQVQEFVDAGAESVVLMFLDPARTTASAEQWMSQVVPRVRPRTQVHAEQGGRG